MIHVPPFNPEHITHIIFDVDGTFYNKHHELISGMGSVEDSHEFFRYATYTLAEQGGDMGEIAEKVIEQYKCAVKDNRLAEELSKFPSWDKANYHGLVARYGSNGLVFHHEFSAPKDYFARILSHVDFTAIIPPDPQLQDTIEHLKERYALGILSNEVFATIQNITSCLGISIDDFALDTGTSHPIFCKETGTSKPELDSFRKLLKLNDINPQQAVYVGDSLSKDIAPALEVGIRAVHVIHKPVEKQEEMYLSISQVQDLKSYF